MKKRTKKDKRDSYRFLGLYLEELADLYKQDKIDDASIMDFVSKELERLEKDKSRIFKIDFLNFLNNNSDDD